MLCLFCHYLFLTSPSFGSSGGLYLVIVTFPGYIPEVLKLFSCSAQLSMKFALLINMKIPTIIGIFVFISIEN